MFLNIPKCSKRLQENPKVSKFFKRFQNPKESKTFLKILKESQKNQKYSKKILLQLKKGNFLFLDWNEQEMIGLEWAENF